MMLATKSRPVMRKLHAKLSTMSLPNCAAFVASGLDFKLHHVPGTGSGGKPYTLGLMQIKRNELDEATAPAVLMVHGAISNGKMFYSSSGRGLAPYLAGQGFNCFVADLRGRGYSAPSLEEEYRTAGQVTHGQIGAIRDDLPTLAAAVSTLSKRPDKRQSWVAHSWGGVLLASAYARCEPATRPHVDSMVCFGTKRHISQRCSLQYAGMIGFGWNLWCPLVAKVCGYLPGSAVQRAGIGMDGETAESLRECRAWVNSPVEWVDPVDGFNYGAAWRAQRTPPPPPTWHLSGSEDAVLGHPKDVQLWAEQTPSPGSRLTELAGYGHNDMVTGRKCDAEHFPGVSSWMHQHAVAPERTPALSV